MRKLFLPAVALALAVTCGAASAGPDVKFLWSEESDQVFEMHSAASYTAVEKPPNWIYAKNNRAKSQEAARRLFRKDGPVIQAVEVSPSSRELAEGPSQTVEAVIIEAR